MRHTQKITQVEFGGSDFPIAEQIAKRLGFTQTGYTSTSGLWGLFCLPDRAGQREGCIVKTVEFGLMFVSDLEDLKMDDLNAKQEHATVPGPSEAERTRIGAQIAELFGMKRDPEHKDRFKMSWGNKTALGVYETFMRVASEIENDTFKP